MNFLWQLFEKCHHDIPNAYDDQRISMTALEWQIKELDHVDQSGA